MSRARLLLLPLLALAGLLAAACGDVSISELPEREGDDIGECGDGADNDGNGLFDCDDLACAGAPECAPNQPPSAPEVVLDPASPTTEDTIRCVIETASVDPEGDDVEYAWSWTLDGNAIDSAATAIDPDQTVRGDVWMCTVVPTDALGAAGPGASAVAEVVNAPPTRPDISIQPGEPQVTDDLRCVVTTNSTDADGDPVSYSFRWLRNGGETGVTQDLVPTQLTQTGDVWACIVTPSDGVEDGISAEDSVTVHVDIFPHAASGRDHTCSVQADGTWACWGSDGSGQLDAPDWSLWKIESGPDFGCGIRFSDTSLTCWGDDSADQSLVPMGAWVDLAAGERHACAARTDGVLDAWGSAYGWASPKPAGIALEVAAGDEYCCARMQGGEVACWGDPPAPDPAGEWTSIDGGADHFCAIGSGGALACWGDDSWGQVSGAPAAGSWLQVSAGWRHTCAVEDGTGFITCWGDDSHGQSSPAAGAFVQVSAGWYHTCGKRPNDTVECWGCQGQDSGQCSPEG